VTIALFRCERFNCSLTIAACVSRRDRAITPAKATSSSRAHLQSSDCVSCEVGEAHARGEHPLRWQDGRAVLRVVPAIAAPAPPKPAPAPVVSLPPKKRAPTRHVTPKIDLNAEPKRLRAAPRKGSQLYAWGGELLTLSELARTPDAVRLGIEDWQLQARLRRGWALDRALTTPPRGGYDQMTRWKREWRGKQRSVRQIAKDVGVSPAALYMRLRSGESLTAAIETLLAKRISPPRPLTAGDSDINIVRGELLEFRGRLLGLADLVRTPEAVANDVCMMLATHRRQRGWDAERIVTTPRGQQSGPPRVMVTYQGQQMTLPALARATGIGLKTLRSRIRTYGWDAERAASTPLRAGTRALIERRKAEAIRVEYQGQKLTLSEVCALAPSVPPGTIRHRILHMGWDVERAISAPRQRGKRGTP
jgi:AcrR family transcriptional regulator